MGYVSIVLNLPLLNRQLLKKDELWVDGELKFVSKSETEATRDGWFWDYFRTILCRVLQKALRPAFSGINCACLAMTCPDLSGSKIGALKEKMIPKLQVPFIGDNSDLFSS